MSKHPYCNFYFGDFFGDTQHLSTEEIGAYFMLLGQSWQRGGPLPADDKILARLTRLSTAKWKRIKSTILDFFTVNNGVIWSPRLEKEREKMIKTSTKRAASGSKGGRAKAAKMLREALANATNLPEPGSSIPDSRLQEEGESTPPPLAKLKPDRPVNGQLPLPQHGSPPKTADDIAVDWFNDYLLAAKKRERWVVHTRLSPKIRTSLKIRMDTHSREDWRACLRRAMRSEIINEKLTKRPTCNWLAGDMFYQIMDGEFDNAPAPIELNGGRINGQKNGNHADRGPRGAVARLLARDCAGGDQAEPEAGDAITVTHTVRGGAA